MGTVARRIGAGAWPGLRRECVLSLSHLCFFCGHLVHLCSELVMIPTPIRVWADVCVQPCPHFSVPPTSSLSLSFTCFSGKGTWPILRRKVVGRWKRQVIFRQRCWLFTLLFVSFAAVQPVVVSLVCFCFGYCLCFWCHI